MDTAAIRVSLEFKPGVDGLSARPRMRGPKTCCIGAPQSAVALTDIALV
jgi:hypothetical protein